MSLGLLGAYISSDSEDSDSSDNESNVNNEDTKANNKKIAFSNPFNNAGSTAEAKTLPRPSFMVQQEDVKSELSATVVENSVFKNPFRIKEDQKKAVLERHVEMTVKQEDQRTIDGKKVCWNFRKGRCRFGSKCTFAHDSDVKQKGTQETDSKPEASEKMAARGRSVNTPLFKIPLPGKNKSSSELYEGNEDDHDFDSSDAVIESNKKSKKRPGLSAGLVPSKKAMKFHEKVYNPK